ncbi:MAG: D-glycero-alpha-D-manno-heptose-1,7-bisphosphate 7-phosphatase [Candidatus Dormibacteria bacterium]
MCNVIMVDRDGVINRRLEPCVHSWGEFEFLPGAVEGLQLLSRSGLEIVVITNQASIGRGILPRETLEEIHQRMCERLAEAGAPIKRIYVCPHEPAEGCRCRKPAPGLLERAADELHLDLARTFFIGDSASDVEAARAAGSRPIIVGRNASRVPSAWDLIKAHNLAAAAQFVVGLATGWRISDRS